MATAKPSDSSIVNPIFIFDHPGLFDFLHFSTTLTTAAGLRTTGPPRKLSAKCGETLPGKPDSQMRSRNCRFEALDEAIRQKKKKKFMGAGEA